MRHVLRWDMDGAGVSHFGTDRSGMGFAHTVLHREKGLSKIWTELGQACPVIGLSRSGIGRGHFCPTMGQASPGVPSKRGLASVLLIGKQLFEW